MSWGRKTEGAGRKTTSRLTSEEFDAMVQAQSGVCALCSEPGSVGDLVVDRDDLKRKVPGLLHSKCKAFLALGRDHPLRFQMATAYLERMSG
jgi:hypothetical protein